MFAILLGGCAAPPPPAPLTFNAELAYLKQVNAAGPARNPAMIFLLMGQLLNANQTGPGIEFFETFLKRHGGELSGPQRSLYLAALGMLRANHARFVPLLQRTAWVEDTIAMLERARRLSGESIFVVQWVAGIVYARLPESFGAAGRAMQALAWCESHAGEAPDEGWLREVYFHLALLHRRRGDPQQAGSYLARGGFKDYDKPTTQLTPYAVTGARGFVFGPPTVREVVPGRVFSLSGFEFTEYYFVLSTDRRHLIAIDAGTRDDSAEAAYNALKVRFPGLPPVSTVMVTHAHWDHVGGHRFFRKLNPRARFYANARYREELRRIADAPSGVFTYFFGSRFDAAPGLAFQPDVAVSGETPLVIGGTRLVLIPVEGGETPDGLMIHLPREGVLFAGDIVMPYFGAPFLEEGSLPGLFRAIDRVVALNPGKVLHGHRALTRLFPTPRTLADLKRALSWLEAEVRDHIKKGMTLPAIHRLNLIPPFIGELPSVQVPYLVMRENLINRLFDQSFGYWRPGLEGLDDLGSVEAGQSLASYLELSASEVKRAVSRMIEAGDYALAVRTLRWAEPQFPGDRELARLKRAAHLKLIEKYQTFNPFKFILYSEQIGQETRQVR